MSDTQWCKWLNNMAPAFAVELYLSAVIWAIGDPPVCIIPHQWASLLVGNLFSATAVIDKALKYKFPFFPNCPPLRRAILCVVTSPRLCCVFIYLCCLCWSKVGLFVVSQEFVMVRSSLTPAAVLLSRANWASPTQVSQWVHRWVRGSATNWTQT